MHICLLCITCSAFALCGFSKRAACVCAAEEEGVGSDRAWCGSSAGDPCFQIMYWEGGTEKELSCLSSYPFPAPSWRLCCSSTRSAGGPVATHAKRGFSRLPAPELGTANSQGQPTHPPATHT